jgi:hypothetical protein
VDIADQGQPIAILIHQESLEASLEHMAHPLKPGIEIAGIAKRQVLHPGGQTLIARLQRQVQVIGHQAKGVHPVAKAAHPFGKQLVEEVPVAGSKEHILPSVTAEDDVVQTAGNVKSRLAGHAPILPRGGSYAIYQA